MKSILSFIVAGIVLFTLVGVSYYFYEKCVVAAYNFLEGVMISSNYVVASFFLGAMFCYLWILIYGKISENYSEELIEEEVENE